jgi:hypothetical protein
LGKYIKFYSQYQKDQGVIEMQGTKCAEILEVWSWGAMDLNVEETFGFALFLQINLTLHQKYNLSLSVQMACCNNYMKCKEYI